MDWKIFAATFGAVFLAEMGDKTQLACLAMTAQTKAPWTVLAAALAGLFLATVLAVAVGYSFGKFLPQALIHRVAGVLFIVIGGVMVWGRW